VVKFEWGDVENLQFENNSFDGTSVAFGVRNFTDLPKGLSEMHRILKPGGKAVILELSIPKNPVVSFFYNFYFEKLMPTVGGWLSRDKEAHGHLKNPVQASPEKDEFVRLMKSAGFKNTRWRSLTFGICMLYVGEKGLR
jgi:demethylmenaquinone methyltransferase/2-methoxy-6-polyprenyl-1,4-benzoquinol methylase